MAENKDFIDQAAAAEHDTDAQKARYGGDEGYETHTANLLKLTEQGRTDGLTDDQLKDPDFIAELASGSNLTTTTLQAQDNRNFDDIDSAFAALEDKGSGKETPQNGLPDFDNQDIEGALDALAPRPETSLDDELDNAFETIQAAPPPSPSTVGNRLEYVDDGPVQASAPGGVEAALAELEANYPGVNVADIDVQRETAAQMEQDAKTQLFAGNDEQFNAEVAAAIEGLETMPALGGVEADISPEFAQAAQEALEREASSPEQPAPAPSRSGRGR